MALGLGCSLAWACAEEVPVVVQDNDDRAGAGGLGAGGFLVDDDAPGGAGGATAGASGVGGNRCGPPDDSATCGGNVFVGKSVPLDIYIMFDQSASMCACLDAGAGQLCLESGCNTTRLDAVRDAIGEFLNDPNSAGIGVGLGLFGQQDIGQTSCDVATYGAPAVEVGALPDQANALTTALSGLAPTGETPTGPALRGACDYARDYRATTEQHQVVLLLLTDGRPEAPTTCRGGQGTCCPSLDDAVAAAEQCRNEVGIRTFVLGVGPLLDNLEQIAVAGGTEQAYLVNGGDVGTEVVRALNRIRGSAAIPCDLALPEAPLGDALALDEVNLEYEGAECARTPFSSVPTAADCADEDGWYYDNPDSPSRIQLCPRSCDRVSGPGGNLYYSVGCATRIR
ncbi:MAG TPA: vWA domain-containing protein [Polyangiaceae bacterium]|nr:vWA domain-containing protein [Polyangiaceae bacterium]